MPLGALEMGVGRGKSTPTFNFSFKEKSFGICRKGRPISYTVASPSDTLKFFFKIYTKIFPEPIRSYIVSSLRDSLVHTEKHIHSLRYPVTFKIRQSSEVPGIACFFVIKKQHKK